MELFKNILVIIKYQLNKIRGGVIAASDFALCLTTHFTTVTIKS